MRKEEAQAETENTAENIVPVTNLRTRKFLTFSNYHGRKKRERERVNEMILISN